MVFLLPMYSIRGPPAIPPKSALSGMMEPTQEDCNHTKVVESLLYATVYARERLNIPKMSRILSLLCPGRRTLFPLLL